ncbi:splicing factor 3B subunit 3 [Pseudohyphozyma bogoriensis]|nr:splicing factor 3B subunit 3 [Pseudohyphozyma bogoriensis]
MSNNPRDAPSTSEATFVTKALNQGLRLDGRSPYQLRPLALTFGPDLGWVECSLGETRVVVQVSAEIVKPQSDRPYEGFLVISTEISPMAAANYEAGRASDEEVLLARSLEKALRRSNAVDREALCIVAGQKVWSIRVDVHFLNDEGNMLDCASIAAITALQHFRRPDVEVVGEEVTVHSMTERVPVPLAIHHTPICLTFAFFPDSPQSLLDPNHLETQLSSGLMTLTLNAQSEICVLTKAGGAPLDADEIMRVVMIGVGRVREVDEFIKKELEKEKHLLNTSLVPSDSITIACVGQFSGTKQQEICVVRGSTRIQLLRTDPQTGKLETVVESEVFGNIRSLTAFKLTGGTKDYIIIGSDSGRIVVLEYDPAANALNKLHQETYGRSGARRIIPGQYICADPKGRAVMIGAMEKSKLVYILNRDAAANLTISSPLEAHKQRAIIHSMVGVDVGFENPLFAALEVDYGESDNDPTGEAFNSAEKMLTYYELDLGLNHVVRKWSEPTDPRANLLVQVPGGQSATTDKFDGPSGVLVCAEDYIIYKHQGAKDHRVPIPKRADPRADPERGVIIVSAVMHKMKGAFFFLLQSEEGDLYKVTIEHEEEEVVALKIKYFDTVPVASSLCILKSGFLFVASEFGNQYLYQFEKLGDDDDETEWSSAEYDNFGAGTHVLPPAMFRPRPLENLVVADELESLSPILDAQVANFLGEDTPQIYTACGRGARSSVRILRQGLEVGEAVSSELPGAPIAVWTTKLKADDEYDAYIILSFVNGTLVLAIGDTIEEVSDTGFISSAPTLGVQQLGDDALLQVYPKGIRHILADKRVNEWKVGAGQSIVACTTNKRQVVVALSTSEIVYFELDLTGQLNEFQERKEMGVEVLTMSIAEVPEGRQRTPYLAVGCADSTVRVISLDPDNTLETLSLQALTAPPSAIVVAEILDASIDKFHPTLFVNIGLQNGVLLRTVLDGVSGQLTDTRTRFLGSRPVQLARVPIHGSPAILALSSRSWLNYTHQNILQFTPLIFDTLDHAWSFSAELCPEGLIGVVGNSLRIFTFPKLGTKVQQTTIPLSYTPRKLITHPAQKLLYTIESDHRTLSPLAQKKLLADQRAAGMDVDEEVAQLPADVFGLPRAAAGNWASCVRIIDPVEASTIFKLDLENNEAAFSAAIVPFSTQPNDLFLVVGTAQDTSLAPRACKTGYLNTYKILNDGRSLELQHKTETDDVPTALLAFQGRLVAGVGKALRIYDIGKKKLLRKVENKSFASMITTLSTQGSRILVGDVQESVHYAVYKAPESRLIVFADDTSPRWTTAMTMVDYNTVAAGDKFGNIFVNRLAQNVSDEVDEDPTGASIMHEKGYLMGAPHKTGLLAHYHIGDIVTSIQKVSLVAGGRDVLLYTGLSGTVGVLAPFVSNEDVDFFTTLEMHLRTEAPSLVGRDHLAYRGLYAPVKSVVDGDLCNQFILLSMNKQGQVAQELDRTTAEVLKKLETAQSSSW